jgi:hypothetical protein
MPIVKDLKTAKRLVSGLIRSRANRQELERRLRTVEAPVTDSMQIAVYFADTKVNLYQLRQWYAPLVELSKTHPVVVISRSPGAMLALMDECPLPVVYLRKIVDFENFLGRQKIKLMLYVNQNTKNFQSMRYGRMWHVFINHGESDKAYMSSNQYKAYDYAMVAGQAAVDRLRGALWDYDVDKRALVIGRPQADYFTGALPYTPDHRTVVFYAPTWEGDRESMSYGSIASHGVQLTRALLANPSYRLIYRPHPRSGVANPDYGRANAGIIAAIAAANAADPAARHVYDDQPELGWQFTASDVAITDISAMVYDRLSTGKTLIVTRPASPLAHVEEEGYLASAEWLTAEESGDIVGLIERLSGDEGARARLNYWVNHHFGDTTPGAATQRFHAAVEHLVAEWHRHAELHVLDPQRPQGDMFDSDADSEDDAPGD